MSTILIVDDREPNRELLKTVLGYRGYHLLEASDGAEALAIVQAEHPDLVITDILMPTMDGYEFVRRVRADPMIAATRVIFYTAHYHKHEAAQLSKACGVSEVLMKPAEPEDIFRTVAKVLQSPLRLDSKATEPEFEREHIRVITDKLAGATDELRIVNHRLETLLQICLQLASERNPERMLESVCQSARELIGAKYAMLAVGRRNERETLFTATAGMDAEMVAALGRPVMTDGLLARACDERRPFRSTGIADDPRPFGLPAGYPGPRHVLVAPIISVSCTYGWIVLTDKVGGHAFDAEDERVMGILAAQAGRTYESATLYAELLEHAAELERSAS